MKKILTIIISIMLICCSVLGLTACNDEVIDEGFDYRAVEESGTTVGYAIAGIGTVEGEEVVIPAIYKNLPVIQIDKNAFDGSGITSVTLPDSIKYIGESAFARCEKLKSLHISSIEGWCNISFEDMASNPMYFATELYVGDNLVTDAVIPDSVKKIPDYAFYECENITSVTIGAGVAEIGNSAFYNCEKLEKIVLNGNVSVMGEFAFAHCQALESVQIESGVAEIGYYAFFECNSLKEVTIPASVKSISESAFSFCTSLEKVTFSEGLEFIGDCAFGGCTSLEEFVMPHSVTEIGFGVLMFIGGYLYDGIEYDSTNFVKKIVMSDKIGEIPDYAFSGCIIPTIAIGKSVTTINYSAFYACEWLESVVIPKSVTKIVSYAFYRCSALNTVYYEGTAEEWRGVSIGKTGNDIVNAEVYYYSEKPADSGNFWHYASDGVTPEKW